MAVAPKGPPALTEPAPVVPTPEEKERAAANARMVPPRSQTSAPAVPVDALMLDRLMERGIAMFNATDQEADRVEAARLIYVTAVLGYGPSRALIARSYPRSQAVRVVAPVVEAVRFALDAFAVGGTYSKNPEHVVTSLAVYLLDQGQAEALASAVVDAMRDDPRLQVIARARTDVRLPQSGARRVSGDRAPGQGGACCRRVGMQPDADVPGPDLCQAGRSDRP